MQPSLRGRSTRKSRRASWPGARRARRCSRKATVSNGSLKSCRTCESGGRSKGGGSSTGCSTGGGSGRACAGLSGELRCRMSAMERPVSRVSGGVGGVEGVGGVGGVECRECRECRNALTLLDTTRTSPLSRWLDTRWTLVSECRAECRSSVDLVSIDTGVGVSGGVGQCRGLVSKCRARAQLKKAAEDAVKAAAAAIGTPRRGTRAGAAGAAVASQLSPGSTLRH